MENKRVKSARVPIVLRKNLNRERKRIVTSRDRKQKRNEKKREKEKEKVLENMCPLINKYS